MDGKLEATKEGGAEDAVRVLLETAAHLVNGAPRVASTHGPNFDKEPVAEVFRGASTKDAQALVLLAPLTCTPNDASIRKVIATALGATEGSMILLAVMGDRSSRGDRRQLEREVQSPCSRSWVPWSPWAQVEMGSWSAQSDEGALPIAGDARPWRP